MITPDRLASWRRTAALDSRTGQPVGDALLDACKEIEELQAAVRRQAARLCDFEGGHMYTKLRRERDYWEACHEGDKRHAEGLILQHMADRDRARDAAVALEQENAYLTELTATCTCYDGNPANYEGPHADCAVHGAVRAFNEAQATTARIRELHAKFVCGCGDDHGIACKECRNSEYPCPTILALDGSKG